MAFTIQSFDELIQVLTLQKLNLGTYLTACNATLADVTEITNELANLIAIDAYVNAQDASKKTSVEIKQALFNGDPSTPISNFAPAIGIPILTAALAGALQRTRARNKRFKAGPGYTVQIGQALGIDGDSATPIAVPPKIDVFTSKMGYGLTVVVTGRGESDAWETLTQPVGNGNGNHWTSIGFSTTKSKDFVYNPGPTATDNPVQLRIMVQLKKNNADYAGPSEIALATVNP
jgi:hypothetical protein